MSKKLYVGGLPFDTTEGQIQTLFAAHGQVTSVKLITDKYSGQSRGFGFVEMPNDTEAMDAIQKLNGTAVGSRQITVNEARPMEDRGSSGGFGGGRQGGGGGRPGGGGSGGLKKRW